MKFNQEVEDHQSDLEILLEIQTPADQTIWKLVRF
jgi:hypothetical protein